MVSAIYMQYYGYLIFSEDADFGRFERI